MRGSLRGVGAVRGCGGGSGGGWGGGKRPWWRLKREYSVWVKIS